MNWITYENTDGTLVKDERDIESGKVPCPSIYPYQIRRELVLLEKVYERDRNGFTGPSIGSKETKITLTEELIKCILAAK